MNTNKYAVVTVCSGDFATKMAQITHPRIAAYAARLDADFLVLRSQHPLGPFYSRYQVRDLLDQYNRILYIDTDVIVAEDCPDLFKLVPANMFGAYDEGREHPRAENIRKVQDACGDIGWREGYINSGVMVMSREHRDVFDLSRGNFQGDEYFEQTQTNYNIHALNIPVFDLGRVFNMFAAVERDGRMRITPQRFKAFMIHYAGLPGLPRQRLGLMARDERFVRFFIENKIFSRATLVAYSYVVEMIRRFVFR